ncbi:MAG: HNH endonuclease, partial [Actinomycetota bacterium]|nr:HNH endonuclease [Actinomycetota bacterium]
LTAGGGLADRPRLVLTDAVTGALLTLTDLPGLRRAGHCGRPGVPPPARGLRARPDRPPRPGRPWPQPRLPPPSRSGPLRPRPDRRCRFPGCRRRIPAAGELDHIRRYPDGDPARRTWPATAPATTHRGKHQAPGWTYRLTPDGTLTVTTPSGLTAVTEAPPY